jgi:ABC-type lipoprotein export system ATPase subunit
MQISLKSLIPFPLKETQTNVSEIWGRDISFNSQSTYLISAASGTGKTTLLHCIYGLRTDYEGVLSINNRNISTVSQHEILTWRRNKLSLVPQGLVLFDTLSFLENILLKNRLSNFKSLEEIKEMTQQLGMSAQLNQKTKTLSYGQKQRLAIIRALCQPFEFLLLDEPFSHLDNTNINIAWQLIQTEAKKQNAGIILTSLGNNYQLDFDQTKML